MRRWVPSLVRVGFLSVVFMYLQSTMVPHVLSPNLSLFLIADRDVWRSVLAALIVEIILQAVRLFVGDEEK